jgi:hypothetical protein
MLCDATEYEASTSRHYRLNDVVIHESYQGATQPKRMFDSAKDGHSNYHAVRLLEQE